MEEQVAPYINATSHINAPIIPGENYHLSQSPPSVTYMWNQWHGLPPFKDVPIVGGIPAMNRLYTSKWRKGYSVGEHKQYSRFKIMIESMIKLRAQNDDDNCFLNEMDLLFAEEKKITPIQRIVKERLQKIGSP